jgi:hypothetical protein
MGKGSILQTCLWCCGIEFIVALNSIINSVKHVCSKLVFRVGKSQAKMNTTHNSKYQASYNNNKPKEGASIFTCKKALTTTGR